MIARRILPLLLSVALPMVAGCMRKAAPPEPMPVAQAEESLPPMPAELLGAPNGKADPPFQIGAVPVVVAQIQGGGSDTPAVPSTVQPTAPPKVEVVAAADLSPRPPFERSKTALAERSDPDPPLAGAPIPDGRPAEMEERWSRASPRHRVRVAFVRKRRAWIERRPIVRARMASSVHLAVYRRRTAPGRPPMSRRVEPVRIASASRGWMPSISRIRQAIAAWVGAVRI